jgi:O-antigen ligase
MQSVSEIKERNDSSGIVKGKSFAIAGVLLLFTVCGIALFAVSRQFVNHEATPKWFGLVLVVGLSGIAWSMFCEKIRVPAGSVFLLLLFPVVFVFLRNLTVSGFDHKLFVYSAGLILLFPVLQQTVSVCKIKYLFGTVLLSALLSALYGILQYAGIFPSLNGNFSVTGSFDNPAGFATALACAFPVGFYFLHGASRPAKYVAASLLAIVFAAVVLSESRAAILACITVAVCYFGSRYSGLKYKNWMKTVAVCVIVMIVSVLYHIKRDSADGRLLIWKCTWKMIKDKPVTGHGYGAFQAKYMTYQADYFEAHPDGKYSLLADNVLHPFNEYLLVWAEHGIAGLGGVLLLLFLLLRRYLRERTRDRFVAMLGLLSLAVCSCFSYPFKYPFAWIIAFMNMAIICRGEATDTRFAVHVARRTGMALTAACLLFTGIPLMKAEIRWNKIAYESLAGKTAEVLPEYDRLYRYLGTNGLFLYNHAAELHQIQKHEESLSVFERCAEYYDDADVRMLVADSYRELKKYAEAERHLKLASAMCPVRFMPPYQLVELYRETGRTEEAVTLARQILNKEIKIPSSTVNAIRNKMKMLIGEQETLYDSATESGTEVEQFNTTKPRHDDLSESNTPKGLVPP